MSKEVKYGSEVRLELSKGVRMIEQAVATTLGPKGRTVLIEKAMGSPLITKDGVTVARELNVQDKWQDLAIQIIKQASIKTNEVAGDGTTTSTVLACAIVTQGMRLIEAGHDPMDVKDGILSCIDEVLAFIERNTKKVQSEEDIFNVARISANNDASIGEKIAEAFASVGDDGVVTVDHSRGFDTYITVTEGMQYDKGYMSPFFCNTRASKVEFENPYILIVDQIISDISEISGILDFCRRGESRPLLIITKDIQADVLNALVVNNTRGVNRCVVTNAPSFGDRQIAMLEDIAILTGGQIVGHNYEVSLKDASVKQLGTCQSLKVSSIDTTIVGGGGDADTIDQRIQDLREQVQSADNKYIKEQAQDRLAKLSGGVATIFVGGTTEIELMEKRHRVEDALSATRAAIEGGIVSGGGITLARAGEQILVEGSSADSFVAGRVALKNALEFPLKTIAENAGENGSSILRDIRRTTEGQENYSIGYNAKTGLIEDMIVAGIIDPAKVTKSAFINACSVAATLLTTECAMIESGPVSYKLNTPEDMGIGVY